MKMPCLIVLSCLIFQTNVFAQRSGFDAPEPSHELFRAPLYPGASYLRIMATLDPYFETAIFISPDPVGDVKNFYRDKLPNARLVQYRDEEEWVWLYLLVPNMPFPDKPTRDDLPLLDATPNVIVKKFQKQLHDPLFEYYRTTPGKQDVLAALEQAKTIIRFTYRIEKEDADYKRLQGVWVNTDRSLQAYYRCRFEFKADNTYSLTMTDDNIKYQAAALKKSKSDGGRTEQVIIDDIRKNNPERGRVSVLRNTIDMETTAPVTGDKQKSGLIEIQDRMFSVQFINMPRLNFMRETASGQ